MESSQRELNDVHSGEAPRVLVVEDEPQLRRAFARFLARPGYDVVTAEDGKQAIEIVGRERFDLIVTDLAMPGMDGITLLKRIREIDLDVPVVLMTGLPDVRTAVQGVEYGAFQYLSKPIDPAQLMEVAARGIKLHKIAQMKREALTLLGRHAGLASDRAGLESNFERAMKGLWMAFQPIVRVVDHRLYGYEALLRTVETSLPDPGAVLDAAEKLGRLTELGRLVRDRSAEAMASRPERGMLFVNLHTRDLTDEWLFDRTSPLSAIADRVVLEITERASLDAVHDARSRVTKLRAMGFRIAIDDLGAGYAGLTSFAHLEPEIVKLDMSLVRDVHKSVTKQKLIRSMTTLCKDMGMLVVGEGVETSEECEALVELGCDLLQGYFFARPGPPFPACTW